MTESYSCSSCKKEIDEEEFVTLRENIYYHIDHFNCSKCKKNLLDSNYFEKDQEFFCEEDYHLIFSPKCFVCEQPIREQYISFLEKNYHREHFKCGKCQKPLTDKIYSYEADSICAECYSEVGLKCKRCDKVILERRTNALNNSWHEACFACSFCEKAFDNNQYTIHEEKPFHLMCYKEKFFEKCFLCKSFCENEYYNSEGKAFDEECLEAYKEYRKQKRKSVEPIKLQEELKIQSIQERIHRHSTLQVEGNSIPELKEDENEENKQESKKDPEEEEEIKQITVTIPNIEKIQKEEYQENQIVFENVLGKPVVDRVSVIEQNDRKESLDIKQEPSDDSNSDSDQMADDQETLISDMNKNIDKMESIRMEIEKIKLQQMLARRKKWEEKDKREGSKRNSVASPSGTKKGKYIDGVLYFSFAELTSEPMPESIDTTKKENYLTDEEFELYMKMTKSQFSALPKWRQIDIKKKNKLF